MSKEKDKTINVTVDPTKFKIKHLMQMEDLQDQKSYSPLLKLVQEITIEDIYEYPADSLPQVIEALMASIDVVAERNKENEEGN